MFELLLLCRRERDRDALVREGSDALVIRGDVFGDHCGEGSIHCYDDFEGLTPNMQPELRIDLILYAEIVRELVSLGRFDQAVDTCAAEYQRSVPILVERQTIPAVAVMDESIGMYDPLE